MKNSKLIYLSMLMVLLTSCERNQPPNNSEKAETSVASLQDELINEQEKIAIADIEFGESKDVVESKAKKYITGSGNDKYNMDYEIQIAGDLFGITFSFYGDKLYKVKLKDGRSGESDYPAMNRLKEAISLKYGQSSSYKAVAGPGFQSNGIFEMEYHKWHVGKKYINLSYYWGDSGSAQLEILHEGIEKEKTDESDARIKKQLEQEKGKKSKEVKLTSDFF